MSPRRRALTIAVVAGLAVLLAVAGIRLLGARFLADREAVRRPDQGSPGPVLLVPGYGGRRAALVALAERLRAAGRTATVLSPPDDGTGPLAAQAATLDEAVRSALAAGAPSVDIVGYSAGGVVARLWVDRYDGATAARRIVTLGSPLRGTQLAAIGAVVGADACPAACQELAPGSDLLRRLEHRPLPPGLPWLSIWTRDDEVVQPPDSARLAGAINVAVQDVCAEVRVAHDRLPTDPLVTAMVLRALGPTPLTAPDDCASRRAP